MKVILLLPRQESRYSIFFETFSNLRSALSSLTIDCRIVEVGIAEGAAFPYESVERIAEEDLGAFLRANFSEDTYFVAVDGHALMRRLYRLGSVRNLLIWVHYLYGMKFIFDAYRRTDRMLPGQSMEVFAERYAGLVPNSAAIQLSRFYWRTLQRHPVVAQSLWTELLLERYFSVPTLGTLLIPVDPQAYDVDLTLPRAGVMVFLGDRRDTNLTVLHSTLSALGKKLTNPIDYFGEEESGSIFTGKFGIEMNYLGKIQRRDLCQRLSQHVMTIAPVYNGNFEMVPVESLLCGTPVISFPQPFMEVTGESGMVACIWNRRDVIERATEWPDLQLQVRTEMRETILEKMSSLAVARKLVRYLTLMRE